MACLCQGGGFIANLSNLHLAPAMGEGNEFECKVFLKAYEQFMKYLDSNALEPPVIFRSADGVLQFLLNIVCYVELIPRQQRPLMHWCFKGRSFANIRPKARS
jgi:hypothetical protein